MNRLKELREERGVSLKELSRCLNVKVSNGQLSNFENGNRNFRNGEIIHHISEYFGVSIPYLLGFSDIKNEQTEETITISKSEYEALVNFKKAILEVTNEQI